MGLPKNFKRGKLLDNNINFVEERKQLTSFSNTSQTKILNEFYNIKKIEHSELFDIFILFNLYMSYSNKMVEYLYKFIKWKLSYFESDFISANNINKKYKL